MEKLKAKITKYVWTKLHEFVAKKHKKAENILLAMKKEKLHGQPEYIKQAKIERKLRDAKKGLKNKLEALKS